MGKTQRTDTHNGVRSIVLTRVAEYNTITPKLRDELAAAIDEADSDRGIRVILLRAEGDAFCAGYRLGYVNTYLKLWYASKPVLAAVQGWCIGGGTDMVLCADLIIAAETASLGYPPSRVWGTPTTAMWVYRMGLERAKRYLLTGDEIPAPEAARTVMTLRMLTLGVVRGGQMFDARNAARSFIIEQDRDDPPQAHDSPEGTTVEGREADGRGDDHQRLCEFTSPPQVSHGLFARPVGFALLRKSQRPFNRIF
jgi:Enoyl-CoA hydratase/isomerase